MFKTNSWALECNFYKCIYKHSICITLGGNSVGGVTFLGRYGVFACEIVGGGPGKGGGG